MSNEKDNEAPRFIPNMFSLKKETPRAIGHKEEDKNTTAGATQEDAQNAVSTPEHAPIPNREEVVQAPEGDEQQTGKPKPAEEGAQIEEIPGPQTTPNKWKVGDMEMPEKSEKPISPDKPQRSIEL